MSDHNEAKWYVIHTYSGYENKVASDLALMVENRKMQDLILDIKIPTETVSSRLTPPEGYTVLEKTTTDSPYSVLQDWEVCDCIHAAEYEDECDFSTVERIEETIPLTETEMEQVEEALRARLYEAYAHRLDIIVVAYHLGNPQLVRVDGTRDALCYEVVTWNAPIDESTMAIWLSEEEFTFYIFLDVIKT